MVYQFPLGPLTLHTLLSGDATRLTDWVHGLPELPPGTTFFNFTASHDGIGVRPAEGLLTAEEMRRLVESTLAHGGQVSYKANADGSRSPYELNITWYDALNDPAQPAPALDVARFLASQAIMLALAGVPGIYVHSLFGSRSCQPCREETGQARSLNREKFWLAEIRRDLAEPDTLRARVFGGYRHLLRVYQEQFGAHPGRTPARLAAGRRRLCPAADGGRRPQGAVRDQCDGRGGAGGDRSGRAPAAGCWPVRRCTERRGDRRGRRGAELFVRALPDAVACAIATAPSPFYHCGNPFQP